MVFWIFHGLWNKGSGKQQSPSPSVYARHSAYILLSTSHPASYFVPLTPAWYQPIRCWMVNSPTGKIAALLNWLLFYLFTVIWEHKPELEFPYWSLLGSCTQSSCHCGKAKIDNDKHFYFLLLILLLVGKLWELGNFYFRWRNVCGAHVYCKCWARSWHTVWTKQMWSLTLWNFQSGESYINNPTDGLSSLQQDLAWCLDFKHH